MWQGWAFTECKKGQSCVFERGKNGNGDNLWYENRASRWGRDKGARFQIPGWL